MSIATILFFFVLTATASACPKNETQGIFVSCEKSCKGLKQVCQMKSRCVCVPDLFRNEKTNLCVAKEKCAHYMFLHFQEEIQDFLKDLFKRIKKYLPRGIKHMIDMLILANNARKIVQSMQG